MSSLPLQRKMTMIIKWTPSSRVPTKRFSGLHALFVATPG